MLEHPVGFEPTTPCFEGTCSVQLSYGCIVLAVSVGLEPTTSTFAGWRSIQLSHETILVGRCGLEPLPIRRGFTVRSPEPPTLPTRNWYSVRDSNPHVSPCKDDASLSCHPSITWWSLSDSNRPPPDCKTGTLPDELRPRSLERHTGFEPVISTLRGWCPDR